MNKEKGAGPGRVGGGGSPVGEVHAGADADVDGAAGEDEGALVRGRGHVQVHVLEAHLPRVLKVAAHNRRQDLLPLVPLRSRRPVRHAVRATAIAGGATSILRALGNRLKRGMRGPATCSSTRAGSRTLCAAG